MARFKILNSELSRRGTTLLETLIGITIIAIVAFSAYQVFAILFDLFGVAQVRAAAADLANERLEIVRNIPYGKIGTIGGIPSGILPQTQIFTEGGIAFNATTTVRAIDDPFDGIFGGSPHDSAPTDHKLVELSLRCVSCSHQEDFSFTALLGGRGESTSGGGALFVQVIDASGLPVQGASVRVTNPSVSPAVDLTDVTDASGFLKLFDVAPAVQSYHVVATKVSYSSDQTYAVTSALPNPVKPDATVAPQIITQVTFAIDRTSQISFASTLNSCSPVGGVGFALSGSKLIGTAPAVLKYSQGHTTSGGGLLNVSGLEWDTYQVVVSEPGYDYVGALAQLPLVVTPASSQAVGLVLEAAQPNALLVTVTDGTTGGLVSDAAVRAVGSGYDQTLITGRGFLSQTDWSGGAGQESFSDPASYAVQDGNVADANPAGAITLLQDGVGLYAASGWLESSTFDTGGAASFFSFGWEPESQVSDLGPDPVRFQVASTSTVPTTWDFLGPDGTPTTYYTSSGADIAAVHDGDRFLRYRAYLQTASTTLSPMVTDVTFGFSSACVPPGQVRFGGLGTGTYTITVQKSGYQSDTALVSMPQAWQEHAVQLLP